MKRILSFLVIIALGMNMKAQSVADSSMMIHMLDFHLSGHMPGGDLAERYGANMGVGGSYMVKMKSNWMLGAEFTYYSGNNFKQEYIFDNIRDDAGIFINIYGEIGEVVFYERGFYTGLKTGWLFPVIGPNPNSGLILHVSGGFLQYKTLIHQDGRDIPSLNGEYKKGYDMLSNGLGLSQFIGYLHIDSDRPINFYAGIEFHQGWVRNRRDYNFYTMGPDDELRRDYLFGIKFGWVFPLNKRVSTVHYYY
jgi:hypothetical protein